MTDALNLASERRHLLSIVMPAHNEREVLDQTHERLTRAADALAADASLDCEFVFINDGSTDGTDTILDRLAATDSRVRAVHLTRNFGHQAAVCAGLSVARGDVIAVMDADLQDPPEVLPEFLAKWREGYHVVYAIREKRKEGMLKRTAYWGFYRLLHMISEIEMPLDSGDFCVMDRSAVDLLNQLPERQRFVRGLRTWIGLKQIGVRYERSARLAGSPSYNFRRLTRLASDGLVSFSTMPLQLVTRMGMLGVVAAVGLAAWVLLATFLGHDVPRGWASMMFLILLLSSIQLICLGIFGEYMARVFLEVKGRPTYLIHRIVGQNEPVTPTQADSSTPTESQTSDGSRAEALSRMKVN